MSGLFDRATEPLPVVAFAGVPLKRLRVTHPTLDCGYVRRLHALYRGGHRLLEDDAVMREVFPKHAGETPDSYKERKARAFYENNFAQVIDRVVAGLAQDAIRLMGETDDQGRPTEIDGFWKDLQEDATTPNEATTKTFDKVIRDAVCEALVARRAWMLIDMPPENLAAHSVAEQLELGALDAYPVMYRADQVTDWCERDGQLVWVRSYSCDYPADDPAQERGASVETWTYWSSAGWVQYKLRLDKEGKSRGTKGLSDGAEPRDEDVLQPEVAGTHKFGVVPWVVLDMSCDDEQNMWLGDRLESQARNLMNEQCGEVYLRLRAMFQQLYEFLGSEYGSVDVPVGEAQQDANRARRMRGSDIVQVRGKDDKAGFVSPEMASAEINLKSIHENRDGMFRVTGQMALSQDSKGAMIKRSADSKKQDKVETEIALGVVGKLALAFGKGVVDMIGLGRKDETVPGCAGYAEFDVSDSDQVIDMCVQAETLTIPSATWKREIAKRASRASLGDEATAEIMEAISDELEQTITQDAVAAMHNQPLIQQQVETDAIKNGQEPKPGEPAPPPAA